MRTVRSKGGMRWSKRKFRLYGSIFKIWEGTCEMINRKRVKSVSFVVTLLVAMLLVAACSSKSGNTNNASPSTETPAGSTSTAPSSPAVEAPKEVSWMLVEFGTMKFGNHLEVYKLLEEAGNMKLDIIPSPIDSYSEKFNITLASGKLPDIISVYGGTAALEAVNENGPKGLFVPLSDHLDKMPNFKAWIDKYPEDAQALRASDGKIYVGFNVKDYPVFNTGFAIREDLLKKNGIELTDIRTAEDLYNAFGVLKKELGGPVMSARYGFANLNWMSKMFGTSFGIQFYSNWDQAYINPFKLPNTKDAVTYMHNMFKDGYLHPDWASMTDQVWAQQIAGPDQKLGFYVDNMQNINGSNKALFEAGKTTSDQEGWAGLLPPAYNGKVYPWGAGRSLTAEWGRAISAKTKALDNILKAWDFNYDINNVEKFVYGVEGETYKLREDGTPEYLIDQTTPEGEKLMMEKYGYGQAQHWAVVFRPTEYFDYARNPKNSGFEKASDLYKDIYTFTSPPIQLNKDETELLKQLKTPFDTFANENMVKFINGQRSLDEWDAFVQELNGKFKGDEIVAIYNGALARVPK